MWILSLLYNETISHRALRLNSTTKVGRSHDYKNDPNCVYIADLKVPKTYMAIKVGRQNSTLDKRTSLSVRFESICTTDINGSIYKLAKKDADPFDETFNEDDLLIKVNANKSDKIKLRLRWVPVVVLPFSKKISFDGVVQQSPLPETLDELKLLGIDVQSTENPFEATHYVTLTDNPDYNLQIAVSRAIPVVSKTWCDFIATSVDEVDSWLFDIRPDMYVHNTRGSDILPNPVRKTLLHDAITAIVTNDVQSKQVLRLKNWLRFLSDSDVFVRDFSRLKDLQSEIDSSPSNNCYVFRVLSEDSESASLLEETNTCDELWNAIVNLDASTLRKPKSLFSGSNTFEKRSLDHHREVTPVSQRRKRRKLERVEDTDFFSFTPVSSSNPQPVIPNPEHYLSLPETSSLGQNIHFEPAQSPEIQPIADENPFQDLNNNLQSDQTIKVELATQPVVKEVSHEQKQDHVAEKHSRHNSQADLSESVSEIVLPPRKKKRPENWIVPEVSLADAVKSTKQQAENNIKHELALDDSVEAQLGKLLVIEDFEMQPSRRSIDQSNCISFQGRKNFKTFRKNGPKQNNITRTFIELVDDGNTVYFENQTLPPREKDSERLQNDFSAEMEDVRGFQPEPPQLFVNEASQSEDENPGESFQFSSRRVNSVPRNSSSLEFVTSDGNDIKISDEQDNQDNQDNDEEDDDDDDDVRFRFSRRA